MSKKTKYKMTESKPQSKYASRQQRQEVGGMDQGMEMCTATQMQAVAHLDCSFWIWIWLSSWGWEVGGRRLHRARSWLFPVKTVFLTGMAAILLYTVYYLLAFCFQSLKNYFGHNNLPAQMILPTHLFTNQALTVLRWGCAGEVSKEDAILSPLISDWVWNRETHLGDNASSTSLHFQLN